MAWWQSTLSTNRLSPVPSPGAKLQQDLGSHIVSAMLLLTCLSSQSCSIRRLSMLLWHKRKISMYPRACEAKK